MQVVADRTDGTRTLETLIGLPGATRTTAPLPLRDATRYDIVCEHGRGGLGRILRARDKELGRDVAIKELLERGEAAELRFFCEALITASLEHPNIISVHDAGRWSDGTPFYAMKLVSGRPLRDVIDSAATLADRLALLPNVIAVADAIAYAHDHRVIHRDLKPSNVLVGQFGETVVIDWGIAKVLDDTPALRSGVYRDAYRETREARLTRTGAALGTPAYMAPEQRAGDAGPCSDIYALGGILFHVLSGRAPHTRGARLPAGTPRDLVAVVDRAMAPDPADRYARALDFAQDLRRFTRREHVSARRYSLAAHVALAAVRHRALTIATLVGLTALTVTFAVAFARIAHANAALTLKHAELLLRSDPTAALAALRDYDGDDQLHRRQLEAEARGLGVADDVLKVHRDGVPFAAFARDGALVTLSEDHRILRTDRGATTTLATGLASRLRWAYAATPHILAYTAAADRVDLLDLETQAVTPLPVRGTPEALAISPAGDRVATVSGDGDVRVWDRTRAVELLHQPSAAAPCAAVFAGNHLIVWHAAGLHAIDLAGGPARDVASPAADLTWTDQRRLDADAAHVVLGNRDGTVSVFDPSLVLQARVTVCGAAVRSVHIGADVAGFGCADGTAGFLALAGSPRLAQVHRFPADASVFAFGPGRLAAATATAVLVHDVRTELGWRLAGHGSQLEALAFADDGTTLATADVTGEVRTWRLPSGEARRVATVSAGLLGASFAPDGGALAAHGIVDGNVQLIALATGGVTELRGHTRGVRTVAFSPDGTTLATPSLDGSVRVWRASDGAPLRVFAGHRAGVQDLVYVDATRLVSAGDDGALRAWSLDGDEQILLQRPVPLVHVRRLARTGDLAVQDAAGDIIVVSPGGRLRALPRSGGAATILRESPDGAYLGIGTDSGAVTIYRTADWSTAHAGRIDSGVFNIVFDPRGREAIVVSAPGALHVVPLAETRLSWTTTPLRAIDVRYAPDGDRIVVACTHGGAWLFDATADRWAYFVDHAADQRRAQFSPDGRSVVTTDTSGSIVVRDVEATLSAGH